MRDLRAVVPFLLAALAAPALAASVVPPAEVATINVNRSGADLVLTWSAVTTDLSGAADSVTAYRVYRGATPSFVPDKVGGTNRVGSPGGTSFTDTGAATAPGNLFYYVSAVDASGNESNTRPAKVTTPPALGVSFSTTAADPFWSGAAPAPSVAGYDLLYGTGAGAFDTLVDAGNVTSTSVFPLLHSVTYYFAVLAYDAERNVAALSNSPSGQLLASGGPTEVCGRISASTTWALANSPYVVTCDVNVYADTSPFNAPVAPAILTIEAGVEVRFNAGTGLNIGNGANLGGLVAQGTAASPILFTANQTFPVAGAWKGLTFLDGTDPSSVINHAAILYGGVASGAAVSVTTGAPALTNVLIAGSVNHGVKLNTVAAMTMQGLTIQNVGGAGINLVTSSPTIQGTTVTSPGGYGLLVNGASSATVQNSTFDHGLFFDTAAGDPVFAGNTLRSLAGFPPQVGANDAGELLSTSTFSGADASTMLQILGETVQANATWTNPGFPLSILGNVTVAGDAARLVTLTLSPGMTLKFASSVGLFIGTFSTRGALIAPGTSAQPITFTTANASPAPGQWQGIVFDVLSDGPTSLLDHVVVDDAGQFSTADVRVSTSAPTIRNSVIRNSAYYGISGTSGASPIIQSNLFTNNVNFDVNISGTSGAQVTGNTIGNSVLFDTAAGAHAVTGNVFTSYNSATMRLRVGAHAVAGLSTNTFNGTGANSAVEVLGETLSSDATWANLGFPYLMLGNVTIAKDPVNAATLTLTPGTTFKFNGSVGLFVGTTTQRGALVAPGTGVASINFTANSASPTPGFWQGIYFDTQSVAATCLLDHVLVEYAGQFSTGNVRGNASSPTVRNSILRNSGQYGVYVTGGGSPVIQANTFTGNASYDVYISGASDAQVTGNSFTTAVLFDTAAGQHAVTGNAFNGYNSATLRVRVGAHAVGGLSTDTFNATGLNSAIEVLGETLSADATWANLGFPYQMLQSVTIAKDPVNAATLTINPGTTLKFNNSLALFVGNTTQKGALVAAGTVAQPITFTTSSASPAPGLWQGIYFDTQSVAATCLLDHVVVDDAGQFSTGAVRASASSPTIRNSIIRNSSQYGINAFSGGSPTIQANTFTGNASYDVIITGSSNAQVTGNTFSTAALFDTAAGTHALTGNVFNGYNSATLRTRVGAHAASGLSTNTWNGTGSNSVVEVLGETLTADATWASLGFPYSILQNTTVAKDAATAATLTINPGATLQFGNSVGLFIGTTTAKGALVAAGTVAQPITFTTNSASPAPGLWQGIYFDTQSVAATCLLDHVVVDYAGQFSTAGVRASANSPTIRNSIVRNSSQYGIYSFTGGSPTIQSNSFTGNASYDVYIAGASNAQVTGNTFSTAALFDTAAGTHALTGNVFNGYNSATLRTRVGAHAAAALSTNTWNGTGANSAVEILGETLATDATWASLGFPYVILSDVLVAKDVASPSTLTISPGATLKFASGVGLNIGNTTLKGALVAAGTVAQPILFSTSSGSPAPGQWKGVLLDQQASAASLLDHCVVEYAGSSNQADVRIVTSSPTVSNSTLRNSSVYGIFESGGGAATIQGNAFSGNVNFDVEVSGASDAQVTGNTFSSAPFFDTAGGAYAVTGNVFNGYNSATQRMRVGAHAVGGLGSNTFNGTGANSAIEILGETLAADATWPSPGFPFIVLGNVVVAKDAVNAATLTLSPGTTLKFAGGIGLFVGTTQFKGALVAPGTAALPILFTTSNAAPAPGQWTAVYFDSMAVGATSLLDHCTVEYGGVSYSADVRIVGSTPTIRNSILRNSSVYGLYGTSTPAATVQSNTFTGNANYDVFFDGGNAVVSGNAFTHAARFDSTTGTPSVTGNSFASYVAPFLLRLGADAVTGLTGNTFGGTDATSKIEILGETIGGLHHWTVQGVPYALISANITVSGTFVVPARLTIDPGVTIRFAASTRLVIATTTTQADLVAQGTVAQPILFTTDSASPAAGQWQGLYLDNGTAFSTVLDHVIVEYAGQSATAGIWLNHADPPITNSTVRFSGSYGIVSADSSPLVQNVIVNGTANFGMLFQGFAAERTPTISGCTVTAPTGYGIYNQGTMTPSITGNTIANSLFFESPAGRPVVQNNVLNNYDPFPLRIGADSIASLTGNTFNGTGPTSRIEILGEILTQDASWAALPVPYQVVSGFVTVANNGTQAATLTLAPGTTIKFASGTGLRAANSSNQGSLVAVGTQAQPILFTTASASPAAGQWSGIFFDPGTVDQTAILDHCTVEYAGQGGGGDLTISNANPTIRNSTFRFSGGPGISLSTANPVIQFNSITGNTTYGVVAASSSDPSLHHNSFAANTTGAISQTSSNIVDARFNWYGDASGPGGSGGGTGQGVTTNVAFDPWLGTSFSTANFFPDLFVSTRTFKPTSQTGFNGQVLEPSNWTVRVFDTGNNVVRTLTGSGSAITTAWDGKDGSANVLADGPYRFQVDATATGTGDIAAPLVGRVSLDGTFALGQVTTPAYLQTYPVGTLVGVLGTAAGTNFTNYSLQFGAGLFPASFSTITTSTTAVNGASLGNWNTSGLGNGVYSVRLLVNNSLTEQTVVNVGTFILAVDSLSLDHVAFSPNGDGSIDEVTASATLSTPASWTINVVNTGTLSTVRTFTGTGQVLTQSWDGTLADGTTVAPEGNYRFDLSAVKSGQTIASSSASTALDVTPPSASISAPTDGTAVFGAVPVSGTAVDPNAHFNNYLLEYGIGVAPLSYVAIGTTQTTPVSSGTLGTWTTNDNTANELIVNGGYQLRLTVTDQAGNTQRASRQVTVDNLVLGQVTASPTTLDTSHGATAQINFAINKPATVTMKIYPEPTGEAGTLLKTLSGSFTPGSHSFVWDATDTTGHLVPDEAYVYVLDADAGSGRVDHFSPPGGLGVGAGSGPIDPSYNPYTNDFWTMPYTNFSPGRVTMQVTPTGGSTFNVLTNEPHDQATFPIEWDGRDASGNIVAVSSSVFFPPPVTLRPNFIITTGNTPRLSAIASDPYRLFMSYAHVSRMEFTLARDATVTITMLPPGVSNPADPSGRVVVNAQPMTAGSYQVLFDPISPSDPNLDTFRFSAEGSYTFAVQAVNATTGATSLRRGVVTMFK